MSHDRINSGRVQRIGDLVLCISAGSSCRDISDCNYPDPEPEKRNQNAEIIKNMSDQLIFRQKASSENTKYYQWKK